MPDPSPLLSPLAQAPNLTSGLVERLTFEIESGKLAPGSRLPTEQALINATGVSRTVVREAISALRALQFGHLQRLPTASDRLS